jgi:hypothetical protein
VVCASVQKMSPEDSTRVPTTACREAAVLLRSETGTARVRDGAFVGRARAIHCNLGRFDEVTSFRSLVALLACVGVIAGTLGAQAASGAPSTPTTLTYEFTGCTGSRTGTFTAVKQPSEAAGLQLTDGSATFVFMEAIDVQSGAVLFTTPGFEHNGLPTVTCDLIHPTTGEELLVKGLLAPVKK